MDNNKVVQAQQKPLKIYSRSTVPLFTALIISFPIIKNLVSTAFYFAVPGRISEARCTVGSIITLTIISFISILTVSYIVGRLMQKKYSGVSMNIASYQVFHFVATLLALAALWGAFYVLDISAFSSF